MWRGRARVRHRGAGKARAGHCARCARSTMRSGRGRLCLRPVAAGIAGIRTARCLSVAMPLSALPSGNGAVEVSPSSRRVGGDPGAGGACERAPRTPPALVAQDNAPTLPPVVDPAPSPPHRRATGSGPAPPLFRARTDIPATSEGRCPRFRRSFRLSARPTIPVSMTEPNRMSFGIAGARPDGDGAAFSPASAADSKHRANKGMRSEAGRLPRYEVAGASVFLPSEALPNQVRAFSGEPIGFGTNIPMPRENTWSGPPQ